MLLDRYDPKETPEQGNHKNKWRKGISRKKKGQSDPTLSLFDKFFDISVSHKF